MIKMLTVKQPYASLIARGEKSYEIRSWCTAYRGPLLIQSSQRPAKKNTGPNGCLICLVDLIDVIEFEESHEFDAKIKHLPGHYAWVLSNPRKLKNIPMKGQLSLFDPPEHIIRYIQNSQLAC